MSRGLTLTVIAAAACSDASGLTLKVFPGNDETQVLVMISDRPCSNDPSANPDNTGQCLAGIGAPPNGLPRVHGTVRFLTDDSAKDYTDPSQIAADTILDFNGNSATIRLLPNPAAGSNATEVLLIGLKGSSSDTAVSFARLDISTVPTKSTYEQVKLEPLLKLGQAAPKIQRWQGSSGRYSCVAFDGSGLSEFYVPTGDPDCDEILLPEECSPYQYDFAGTIGTLPDPEQATCALGSGSGSAGLCVVGQLEETCADGSTPSGSVTPTCADTLEPDAPCLPKSMCSPGPCSVFDAGCYGSNLDVSALSHIDCTVAYGTGSDGSSVEPCAGIFALPDIGGAICSVTIETPMSGVIDIGMESSGFGSAAQFVDGMFQTPDEAVTVVPMIGSGALSTCGEVLLPPQTASKTMDAAGNQLTLGYVRLQLRNAQGSALNRGQIMPIILRYPPASATPSGCGGSNTNDTICTLVTSGSDLSLSQCVF